MNPRKMPLQPVSQTGWPFRIVVATAFVILFLGAWLWADAQSRAAPQRRIAANEDAIEEMPRTAPFVELRHSVKPTAVPALPSVLIVADKPARAPFSPVARAEPESAHLAEPSRAPPALSSAPPAAEVSAAPQVALKKVHRVAFAALQAWSKPGLCSTTREAGAVRRQITANFRLWEPTSGGKFYLDPRLPEDSELPILAYLEHAESETQKRLGLRPPRPLVFAYADQQLMKAAACINENAVAFYDGALHIVLNRADVSQSVLHEYTHHALFSSGFVTPAWAQEGVAMNIAQEHWWRTSQYLQALLTNPFGLDQMDRSIPYKLPGEQAIAFYVQSAALVECLMQNHGWDVRELVAALRAGASADALSYYLPELEKSTFFGTCFAAVPH